MARVHFTGHLRRFFPRLEDADFDGATVAEVLASVEARHPGLRDYLVDDRGSLRQHVNVFLGDSLVHDRERLSDPVPPGATVSIFQALSGG